LARIQPAFSGGEEALDLADELAQMEWLSEHRRIAR